MEAKSINQPFNNINLGPNPFESIPDELTEIVLKSLSLKDQLAAEGVCSKWKELVNSGTLRVVYIPPRGKSPEFYIPFYNFGIDNSGIYIGGYNNKGPDIETTEKQVSKKLANKAFKISQRLSFEMEKTEKEKQKMMDKIKEAFKNRVWECNDLNHEGIKEARLYETFYAKRIYIPSDDLFIEQNGSIHNSSNYTRLPEEFVHIKLPPSFIKLINEYLNVSEEHEKECRKITTELTTNFEGINKAIQ